MYKLNPAAVESLTIILNDKSQISIETNITSLAIPLYVFHLKTWNLNHYKKTIIAAWSQTSDEQF